MGKRHRDPKRRASPGGGGGRASSRRADRQGADAPRVRTAAEGVALLAEALLREQGRLADAVVDALVAQYPADAVDAAVDDALVAAVARSWERGWQAADLVHAVGRKLPAPDRRLLVRGVSRAAERWRHLASSPPEWVDQVRGLEAEVPAAAPDAVSAMAVTTAWSRAERLDRIDALLRAAALLGQLWSTPPVPPIGDPPSRWGRPGSATEAPTSLRAAGPAPAGVDARALGRVRALLAKAESTEFAPEAEALSAKAQELITRYSIDDALLAGRSGGSAGRGEQPISRRLLIHDPYAKGKSALLASVARTNGCQSIWFPDAGFSTVVGYRTDLTLTDLLFTSLVAQCSTAMQVASRDVRQPRAFRESFTMAFATRIGERLEEAAAAVVADAVEEQGPDLLPVLASRAAEVERAFDEAFPHRRTSTYRISDGQGWDAGRAAADVATIARGTRAVEG